MNPRQTPPPSPQPDSRYPRDRFDDVPPYRDRRGVHRSAPPAGTGPSGLVGISIAAAFALVVGAFCFLVLPSLLPAGTTGTDGSAAAGSTATAGVASPTDQPRSGEASPATESAPPPSDEVSVEPTAAASTEGAGAEAEESETASAEPEESETAVPDTGDTSAPVEVYNATRVGGLAGRVSGTLTANGFAVVASANWQGFSVPRSAVYYSQNPTTAQAVAAQLGLPLVQDPRIPGVAVVLAADYSG